MYATTTNRFVLMMPRHDDHCRGGRTHGGVAGCSSIGGGKSEGGGGGALLNECVVASENEYDICVDTWNNNCATQRSRRKGKATFYFLTHAHQDHLRGAREDLFDDDDDDDDDQQGMVYCTETTKMLLVRKFPRLESRVKILEYDSVEMVSVASRDATKKEKEDARFNVYCLDAGHCPGSAMFVFEGAFGKVLHTGDFRREDWCGSLPTPLPKVLDNRKMPPVDVLYLDNTYNNPEYDHPPRTVALERIVKLIMEIEPERPVILLLDSLGKEDVVIAVSQATKSKVFLNKDRYNDWIKLGFGKEYVCNRLGPNESTRVRVLPKSAGRNKEIVCKMLVSGLKNYKEWGPLVISPTGWARVSEQMREEDEKREMDTERKEKMTNEEKMEWVRRSVPYSLHSSYRELETFVKRIQPRKIIGNTRDDTLKEAERKGLQEVLSVHVRRLEPYLKPFSQSEENNSVLKSMLERGGRGREMTPTTKKPLAMVKFSDDSLRDDISDVQMLLAPSPRGVKDDVKETLHKMKIVSPSKPTMKYALANKKLPLNLQPIQKQENTVLVQEEQTPEEISVQPLQPTRRRLPLPKSLTSTQGTLQKRRANDTRKENISIHSSKEELHCNDGKAEHGDNNADDVPEEVDGDTGGAEEDDDQGHDTNNCDNGGNMKIDDDDDDDRPIRRSQHRTQKSGSPPTDEELKEAVFEIVRRAYSEGKYKISPKKTREELEEKFGCSLVTYREKIHRYMYSKSMEYNATIVRKKRDNSKNEKRSRLKRKSELETEKEEEEEEEMEEEKEEKEKVDKSMEYPNATIVRKKPDNLNHPATKSYEERLHEYRIGVRKKRPKKTITEKKHTRAQRRKSRLKRKSELETEKEEEMEEKEKVDDRTTTFNTADDDDDDDRPIRRSQRRTQKSGSPPTDEELKEAVFEIVRRAYSEGKYKISPKKTREELEEKFGCSLVTYREKIHRYMYSKSMEYNATIVRKKRDNSKNEKRSRLKRKSELETEKEEEEEEEEEAREEEREDGNQEDEDGNEKKKGEAKKRPQRNKKVKKLRKVNPLKYADSDADSDVSVEWDKHKTEEEDSDHSETDNDLRSPEEKMKARLKRQTL